MNALADEDILQCLLVEIVRCTLDPVTRGEELSCNSVSRMAGHII